MLIRAYYILAGRKILSTKSDTCFMNYYNFLAPSRGVKMRCISFISLVRFGDFKKNILCIFFNQSVFK